MSTVGIDFRSGSTQPGIWSMWEYLDPWIPTELARASKTTGAAHLVGDADQIEQGIRVGDDGYSYRAVEAWQLTDRWFLMYSIRDLVDAAGRSSGTLKTKTRRWALATLDIKKDSGTVPADPTHATGRSPIPAANQFLPTNSLGYLACLPEQVRDQLIRYVPDKREAESHIWEGNSAGIPSWQVVRGFRLGADRTAVVDARRSIDVTGLDYATAKHYLDAAPWEVYVYRAPLARATKTAVSAATTRAAVGR